MFFCYADPRAEKYVFYPGKAQENYELVLGYYQSALSRSLDHQIEIQSYINELNIKYNEFRQQISESTFLVSGIKNY